MVEHMQGVAELLISAEFYAGRLVLCGGTLAAVVWGGFRLAGFRLGISCEEVLKQRKATEEERAAQKAYDKAASVYRTAHMMKQSEQILLDAGTEMQEHERLLAERKARQAARVKELDAIRAERKAQKAREEAEAAFRRSKEIPHEGEGADSSVESSLVGGSGEEDQTEGRAARAGEGDSDVSEADTGGNGGH